MLAIVAFSRAWSEARTPLTCSRFATLPLSARTVSGSSVSCSKAITERTLSLSSWIEVSRLTDLSGDVGMRAWASPGLRVSAAPAGPASSRLTYT